MTSFRAEIVLNKAERIAEGEALKGELRQLVEHLQAKFLEVEGAIGTLTATAAAAAATGPSRQDPWFLPGQPSPGQPARAVHFAMDVDDELSRTVSGPPGVSPSPAPPGPPGVSASPPAWGSTWQSGRPEGRTSEFKVETRNWKSASLDLEVNPEGFLAWRDRALVLLSGNRLDVRRLLLWAEQSTVPLDAAAERKGAHDTGLVDDVAAVSLALYEGLLSLVSDSLLSHLIPARKKASRHHASSQDRSSPRRCRKQAAATAWPTATECQTSASKPCTSRPTKGRLQE